MRFKGLFQFCKFNLVNGFNKSDKKKILYCNGCVKLNEACILLTQYGYENLYVLEGGINMWKKNMKGGTQTASKDYSDEAPQLDYSLLTNSAGNDSTQTKTPETQKKLNPPVKKKKKKTIEEGCN